MLRFFVGTQVNCQSLVFQISTVSRESLQPLSSICSGSEPFRPVEHLAVCRRWNILANKSGDSAGEYGYSVVLIFLSLQLLSESKICFLQLFLVRYTFWFVLFGFEISRSESFWPFMLCFHTQFNIIFHDLVFFWLDLSFSLCLDFYRELHMFCWQGAVPSPESS